MSDNYYYDAPDRFTHDETVTFEVGMDAPQFDAELVGVSKHEAHFYGTDSVLLPYPIGARVGVMEPWGMVDNSSSKIHQELHYVYRCHYPAGSCVTFPWQPASTMPDDAIRHWYTVTAVDVVKRDGKWFERVTMRRDR